jgi:hypothetical protein
VLQFELLRRLLPTLPATVLPLGFEALPSHPRGFDTVFSMGLLYHRKSPLDHLRRLGGCLTEVGQLVLETLVVEPGFGPVFQPRGRYANMGNVWSIPSIPELLRWLDQVGFAEARVTDVSVTSVAEQRTTRWSSTHSLREALDPNDVTKTIEGYPAPRRAMASAITFAPTTGATKLTSATACAVCGASAARSLGALPPNPALKIARSIGVAASAAARPAAKPFASRKSKIWRLTVAPKARH